MGPTLICDKSSLQALSRDELNSLRKYYSLSVPPILLIEILADLKKQNVDDGRREVQLLANKIVPACSRVNADFRFMIRGELAGHEVKMHGVPVILGAQQISNGDGQKGLMFEESTEDKALMRWQVGDFQSAEMLLAEAWRASSHAIDLEGMRKTLKDAYSGKINLHTLAETAKFVDNLLQTASPFQLLTWFLGDARIPLRRNEAQRVEALRTYPPGSLARTLPYATYCLRTALIFHFGLAFGLVSTLPTCRLDLEYFYYAPFCHVFSSRDRFHRKMSGVIVRDQMFVVGDELKLDLASLALQQPEGDAPPANENSITFRAWEKRMQPGYRDAKEAKELAPEESAKMLKKFQDMMKNKPPAEKPSISMDDCDFMIMEHSVRFDGPCICGGSKMFKDCCGQGLAAQKQPRS